jgi:hypothetical protein
MARKRARSLREAAQRYPVGPSTIMGALERAKTV